VWGEVLGESEFGKVGVERAWKGVDGGGVKLHNRHAGCVVTCSKIGRHVVIS
jgi:hypothetical protein